MNEPQSQMCSMTINGKMLLIGGEGDYGYSAWRVSNCGFNVSHNKSHSPRVITIFSEYFDLPKNSKLDCVLH